MAQHARGIIAHLLPGVRFIGTEAVAGSIAGERGDSLKLSLRDDKLGVGEDFATGQPFGDLIDLWMATRCCDFRAACEEIETWLGTPFKRPVRAETGKGGMKGDRLGAPTAQWHYHDAGGRIIATVYRYDSVDLETGRVKKEFRPWDAVGGRYRAPDPRPLYNLPGILEASHVVVTEGEKAAQALIDRGIPATTAMGGANAPIDKTDWAPLAGKRVLIWPDNDAPGSAYAARVKDALADVAGAVSILAIPADKPAKWDAADASEDEVYQILGQAPGRTAGRTLKFDLTQWTARAYDGEASPITWLFNGTVPLGVPMMVASLGGLGKSFLTLDAALKVATADDSVPVLGGRVMQSGSVVIISAEDGKDSIHRRLESIDPRRERNQVADKFIVVPLPDAGGPFPLIGMNGRTLVTTPMLMDLRDQLEAIKDLRLVVIDPLQAFVHADVNADPAAGQFLWSTMAEICSRTGATLLMCHHMKKDGAKDIKTPEDAREAIRGTTALVDGPRLAYALWREGEEDARRICTQMGLDYARDRIVNGAVVKANDKAFMGIQRYARLPSGLLVDCTEEIEAAASAPVATAVAEAAILAEVDRRWAAGQPFSPSPQTGGRYFVTYLSRQLKVANDKAKNILEEWICENKIIIDVCNQHTKSRGLRTPQGRGGSATLAQS